MANLYGKKFPTLCIGYTYTHENLCHYTCAASVLSGVNAYKDKMTKEEQDDLYSVLAEALCKQPQVNGVMGLTQIVFAVDAANQRGYAGKSCDTAGFMNWLIENKIGVVVASPVTINMRHAWNRGDTIQGWMWLPPLLVKEKCIMADTGGVFNFPEEDQTLANCDKTLKMEFEELVDPQQASLPHFTKAKLTWKAMRMKFMGNAKGKKKCKSEELFSISNV